MKTIYDIQNIAKQYVQQQSPISKKKCYDLKVVERYPSSNRIYPSSGNHRSSESLGLKSLLTPPLPIRDKPNLSLKAAKSKNIPIKPLKTFFEQPEFPPLIGNILWKQSLGISSYLDAVPVGASGSKSINKKELSGQPLGLGAGLPPLAEKSSGYLPSSLIPLLLFSFTYFSTYSAGDLLTILENMGLNKMWVTEMLGISAGPTYDLTPFISNDSSHDLSRELQKLSTHEHNYQFFKILGLVAGGVGAGVILLWLASNGIK